VLPALDELESGGAERRTVRLTSQYFDTADRDLQAHRLLLRRRDGDDDTGWQLKIPAAAKADRRLAAASNTGNNVDLHRARKAAKRARYAAELLKSIDGASAARTVKRYKKIQTILGDHQDSVVAADTLRRLGVLAGTTADENGFTFGLLYAAETQAAQHARAGVAALLS
jgi:CHAD domain-containing protein